MAALVLGLTIGDLYADRSRSGHTALGDGSPADRRRGGTGVVFVESVIVTYFIGTSRWCKEVVETYRFDPRSRKAIASNGGRFPGHWPACWLWWASSRSGGPPIRRRPVANTQDWSNWHLAGAVVGVVFIAWTYIVAWNNVVANQAIIERLVAEVGRVRPERGLDDAATGRPEEWHTDNSAVLHGVIWVSQRCLKEIVRKSRFDWGGAIGAFLPCQESRVIILGLLLWLEITHSPGHRVRDRWQKRCPSPAW